MSSKKKRDGKCPLQLALEKSQVRQQRWQDVPDRSWGEICVLVINDMCDPCLCERKRQPYGMAF